MSQKSPMRAPFLATFCLILFTSGLASGAQNTMKPLALQQNSQQLNDTTPTTVGMPDTLSQYASLKLQAPPSGIARNFKEWTRQGGWVMYPIYADFILGLGVVIYLLLRVVFDKRRAIPIKPVLDKRLSAQAHEMEEKFIVQEIWEAVGQHSKSILAQLLNKLCDLWQRDPSAEVLQVEIKGHLETEKERYELGRNFAVLLSDTAGALGLLGTVLGMYQTFMPGRLESTQVIVGMGVALVTTIGGLIVSIILNFATSYAHSVYLRHFKNIEEQADKFRYRFGKGQSLAVRPPLEAVSQTSTQLAEPFVQNVPEVSMAVPPRRAPTNMKILSGNLQIAEVGAVLPKTLEVAVEDQFGKPMPNLTVTFETNGSLIKFDNGENAKKVETDFLGRAKTKAMSGKSIGHFTVTASVNGESNLMQKFEIEVRPGLPDKLHVLSGNLQVNRCGELLPEPLSLKLEDACGNPVPDQTVLFEVTHNAGRFNNDKTKAEIRTNEDGIASIGFRLAGKPGSNIVKAKVKSKTTHKLETAFESMGWE